MKKQIAAACMTLVAVFLFLNTCTDNVTTTYELNVAPCFNLSFTDTAVEIGSVLLFALQANDANDDAVVFGGQDLPAGASLDSLSGLFIWKPDTGMINLKDTLTFTVSDGVLSDTTRITVSVLPLTISNKRYTVPVDFASIQAAINACKHGDTVIVKPGIYRENISYKSKALVIASDFIFTHDPATIAATVIKRKTDTSTTPVVEMSRCPDSLAPLALVGVTLRNGYTKYGGGISVSSCSPQIAHCVIDSNIATGST